MKSPKKVNFKEELERTVIGLTIKYVEDGYGKPCPDFEPECIQCQAGKVVQFLKEHLDALES